MANIAEESRVDIAAHNAVMREQFNACYVMDCKVAKCASDYPTTEDPDADFACGFICCCNEFPSKSAKDERDLKQICVDSNMRKSAEVRERQMISSPMFHMRDDPPSLLVREDGEPVDNIWSAMHRVKQIEGAETYVPGGIRIPDVGVPEYGDDGAFLGFKLFEIKFPGDVWHPGQREAYESVTGRPGKFWKLAPDVEDDVSGSPDITLSCQCKKRKQKRGEKQTAGLGL